MTSNMFSHFWGEVFFFDPSQDFLSDVKVTSWWKRHQFWGVRKKFGHQKIVGFCLFLVNIYWRGSRDLFDSWGIPELVTFFPHIFERTVAARETKTKLICGGRFQRCFLFLPRSLGKWSNLTCASFFRRLETINKSSSRGHPERSALLPDFARQPYRSSSEMRPGSLGNAKGSWRKWTKNLFMGT